jgi:hypothetical protein
MPKRIEAIKKVMGKGNIHLHDMHFLSGTEVQAR